MMSVAQRLDCCLDDEIRRAEVRLTDPEVDDVAALRHQRIGACQYGEGVFLADTIKGRDCTKHNCVPPAGLRAWHGHSGASSVAEGSSADQAVKIKRRQGLRRT